MKKGTIQSPAFVLRTVDYGDSDVIVTLLTRESGKVSAIARSAKRSKKRFAGCLLPMRSIHARVEIRANGGLARLVEASVVCGFEGIEKSFEKITIASYATELVRESLKEGEAGAPSFDLLENLYQSLADAADQVPVLRMMVHHFELSLLELLGASPMFYHCHRCQRPSSEFDKYRCSRTGEGLVCGDCRSESEQYGILSPETLSVLHYLSRPGATAPQAVAESNALAQVRRVIDASLESMMDKTPKSRPMLDEILR